MPVLGKKRCTAAVQEGTAITLAAELYSKLGKAISNPEGILLVGGTSLSLFADLGRLRRNI